MDKIFVKIASYRDAELPKSILSALTNARFPQRVTFGICWQYDEVTMLDMDPFIGLENIRIDQTYYENSKGCCWARHHTDQLYQGEEYMLQIDAHTRFAPDWDERYISMLAGLESNKPVLSTYPAPFEYRDGNEFLFRDRGMQPLQLASMRRDLTTTFTTQRIPDQSKPVQSQFLAAGQIFSHGRFCEEVEYDPGLYYAGEEISLSARAYTHGYDFYCPNEDLVWHLYQHSMPIHSADHSDNQHGFAIARLNVLLMEDHRTLGKYGLGFSRSLADYEQFAGLDFDGCVNRKPEPTDVKTSLRLRIPKITKRNDYDFWLFSIRNADEEVMYRKDLKADEIPTEESPYIELDLALPDKPISYVLWPHTPKDGFLQRHVEQFVLT